MLSTKLKEAAGNSADATLYVDDVFSTYLYTGNGGTGQTLNTGINLSANGGMVWLKARNSPQAGDHNIYDTVRGASKYLISNLTVAQATATSGYGLTSFSTNGFTLGNDWNNDNRPDSTYAAWTFRKAAKFFDVQTVTHTNGTANNIDLSVLGTVGMVIAKITSTTGDWTVWHRGLTAGNNLQLNLTNAQSTTNAWLSVSGTTATLAAAAPTGTYVIYAYAHDTSSTGIIQCGSFTTDASGNATVNLGWEPQYLLYKGSNIAEGWGILDSMRGFPVGSNSAMIRANTSAAEISAAFPSPSATGFYGSALTNLSNSSTYIYMAIRRPNKPPTTGTQVYNAIARTGTGAVATVTGVGFAPDFLIDKYRSGSLGAVFTVVTDRLRGPTATLGASSTNAESTSTGVVTSFNMDGISVGSDPNGWINYASNNWINYFFKRAPGFFDVVCYTGTGSATTQAHNLGAVPELMIVKNRTAAVYWAVYNATFGAGKFLLLNDTYAGGTDSTYWNDTAPTSSVFTVGINQRVNYPSNNFVAYLFATLAGISKVGSYTGNGSSQNINCGFAAGARFVLIKRTDSTGDWYVWDTARGIVAANDPHLSLNTTAAEVTTDDSVDPYSAGFAVNQVAATNINVSSATYIFLAIA